MPSESLPAPLAAERRRAQRGLFLLVFPSVMLAMFMAAVDQTIVATALPAIAGTLGEVERVSWVVVSYLVAATIAAPVYGALGDRLGRRRMLFVALGTFIAASALCALAGSILALTAARVLQGLGGGGLMTLSQALIGEVVPPRERGRYQGYMAAVFMTASTFGPVAGGYLTQAFGWPSVFWVNLPLGAVALLLAWRLPRTATAPARPGQRFDLLGVVLFAGFITPALLALERGQRLDRAGLAEVAALLAAAAVSLLLLLRQEARTATPLLPVGLLRQSVIWRTNAMAVCIGATLVSMIAFLPMYLQVVRATTAAQAGLLMLPLTVGIAVGALFTGQMMSRTGRTALFPSIGLPVAAGTLLVLAGLAPRLSLGQLPFAFALVSMTLGTGMPVVQVTVQSVAGRALLGAASASVQLSRSVGAAFGTALVGAVLFAALAADDAQVAGQFAELVQRGPEVLAALGPARAAAVQAEIAHAFRAAFAAIATFAAIGAALAWSIPVRRI